MGTMRLIKPARSSIERAEIPGELRRCGAVPSAAIAAEKRRIAGLAFKIKVPG
jgi:hypothetical protein